MVFNTRIIVPAIRFAFVVAEVGDSLCV